MKINRLVIVFTAMILAFSCRNDDDDDGLTVIPPQTLAETIVDNDAEITAFLQSHFYNYEEFENPPADFDFKVRFDTIAGDNSDKIPIMNRPELKSEVITVESSAFFGLDEETAVNHTYYYLVAREGAGENPTIGDNVVMQFEGSLIDGTLFDASSTPVLFYLSSVVRGFGNGVEHFKVGTGPIENGDGTVSYEDFGVGAIIMPSGLGYFNAPPTAVIPNYAPLIFNIEVLAYEVDTDVDGDGIPGIQEDLNGDGNLNNDNTDDDLEGGFFVPNHNDSDDDQDGILTIDEILIDGEIKKDANGLILFPDSDGDGTPDHLDSDS